MKKLRMILISLMIGGFFVGCDEIQLTDEGSNDMDNIVLTMAVFSNNDKEYFKEVNSIESAYRKINPNVEIELDIYKDVTEFENAMKIKKTADELPDIIPLKGYMIEDFKDVLEPLDDLEAVKKNIYAKDFAIDGKVLGIPQTSFNEFVYYNKAIFEEYGLNIPTTWDEFLNIVKIINEKHEYVPIAMAGKDVWPVYPFNSYMPFIISNNGALYDTMGSQIDAFEKHNPFYIANYQVKELYDINPFGDNVLEVGWNEAKSMFISKESAMIAAGQWFLPESISAGVKQEEIGVFLLPVRKNREEVFRTVTVVDLFMSTPKDGKHVEEANEFINWFFCSDYYGEYIEYMQQFSTMKGMKNEISIISEAFNIGNLEFVLIKGEGALARELENSINFSPKQVGQNMLRGHELDEIFKDLDERWKKYKNNVDTDKE